MVKVSHPPTYIPHFGPSKVCVLQNIAAHVDGGMSDHIKHAETHGARTTIGILFNLLKIPVSTSTIQV